MWTCLRGRQANSSGLIAALVLCLIACRSIQQDEVTYKIIRKQIESNDYDAARPLSEKAWRRNPDTEWGWRFKAEYVLLLIYADNDDKAAELLQAQLPASYAGLKPRYQYVKAYLAWRLHRKDSVALASSAVSLAREAKDYEDENESLLLLAQQVGDDKQQRLDLLNRALATAKQNHLEFQTATTLMSIGSELTNEERCSEAISAYYLPAAQIAAHIQARFLRAFIEDSLGLCYLKLGNLDQAAQSFEEGQARMVASDPQILKSDMDMELGRLALLRQDNAAAVDYFRKAFAVEKDDTKSIGFVPAIQMLAAGLIETGQIEEAEKLNESGRKALLAEPHPENYFRAAYLLNRADILARRGEWKEAESAYRQVLQIHSNDLAELEWAALARLANLEAQQGKVLDARRDFENTVEAIERNRSRQKATEHQITFLSALIRFYQQYVAFLMKQGKPWEALAVADSSRASVLTQGLESSRNIPDFSAQIRTQARESNSVLLFYWLAPERSWVWVVTPKSEDFRQIAGEKQISQDVNRYSATIQRADEDPLKSQDATGIRLYETLIAPVAAHIERGMRVVVVPDGALHGLNFETLLVLHGAPHYWLEDVTLSVAPSLRILLQKGGVRPNSGGALVIGDGIYSGGGYEPLPESKREVADVSALFPKGSTTVLTQQDAVPESYKRAKPELFSVIHFSAHVNANEKSPLDSAIILSAGQYGNRQLYARDLMQASHLNADLVTISGCNSVGKKPLAGEGMVGFAWAAFEAGARNALTSLWEVDDQSTTELMNNFYTGVRQRQTPYAQALHDAKLKLLQGRYKKPYYWAAFQLYSRGLAASQN